MRPLTHWECAHCSTINHATSPFCVVCGAASPVTRALPETASAQQPTQPIPAYASGLNASSAGKMQAPPISLADLEIDARDDVPLASGGGMLQQQQQKVSSQRTARRGLVSRRELFIGLAGIAAIGGLSVAVYQWSQPKPSSIALPHANKLAIPTPLGVNDRLLPSQKFSFAWSSDGVYLACSCAGGSLVVKKAAADTTLINDTSNIINDIAWSPLKNSLLLACAGDDGTVQISQMPQDTQSQIYRDHANPVQTLSWTQDGKYIASADLAPAVNVWEVATLHTLSSYRDMLNGQVTSLSWSPDGKRLACGCADNSVLVLDIAGGQAPLIYQRHQQPVEAVSWSPDGRYLASAGDDKTVQVWSPETGEPVALYSGHTDKVWCLAWSPDSQFLASGSWDKTVCIWNILQSEPDNPYQVFTDHQDRVVALDWSKQGRIGSVDASGAILLWGMVNRSSGEN
jgi:WD40 repeat protein